MAVLQEEGGQGTLVKCVEAQSLLGEKGSYQCQGWKNPAAKAWLPFILHWF